MVSRCSLDTKADMGVHDAPQWLISAWLRTCRAAGATAPPEELEAVGERLLDRWSETGRHFHNTRHLSDVLARVDELAEETHEPDLVRLAAWYHGAIFDAAERASYAHRGGEDEQASAVLAREELTALGLPAPAVARVVDLVVALARHSPSPGDFDCAVLCDADLAMLAAEPQRYKAYLADVRAEYAHLPVEEFVRARIAILQRLEQRDRLFASPLGAAWEEPARQNLGAELHRLRKELVRLEKAGELEVRSSGSGDGSGPGRSGDTASGVGSDPSSHSPAEQASAPRRSTIG
jgi:predicted metal-dependent HD superfamily phosphohydrolase